MRTVSGNTPRVSIIMPSYNSAGFIVQALESVFAQSYSCYEVIVVDDGSTDDTGTVLAPYRDRIRYFYQENSGPSAARNRGLELASGEFVVFLDSDDILLPGKLVAQVACFDSRDGTDLVHSGWRLVNHAIEEIGSVEPWRRTAELDLKACLQVHPFYMGAMMLRRDTVQRVGGFNSDLRQAEDIDLVLRMMLNGSQATWLKQTTVMYRQHQTSLTHSGLERVQSVNRVFADFFARPDLPGDICALKRRVLYDISMWSVWQLYRSGHRSEIPHYLQQSVLYAEGTDKEILLGWVHRLRNECAVVGRMHELGEFWPYFKAALRMDELSWAHTRKLVEWITKTDCPVKAPTRKIRRDAESA